MSAHTPGPWHPGHFGGDGNCQCKTIVDEGYAGGIATVHVDNGIKMISEGGNDCPPKDEAVANMHLIAAAPEMLSALRMFRCIDFDHFTEHDELLLESVIRDADAAIEKALGK